LFVAAKGLSVCLYQRIRGYYCQQTATFHSPEIRRVSIYLYNTINAKGLLYMDL